MKSKPINLTTLFTDSDTVKVLEYFILGDKFAYSTSDIAESTKVDKKECAKIIKKLLKQYLVVKGAKQKTTQLYQVDKKHAIVKGVKKLITVMIKEIEKNV